MWPGLVNPGTAHLKRGRKFREQPFYPDPQFRFIVDDAVLSVEKCQGSVENQMSARSAIETSQTAAETNAEDGGGAESNIKSRNALQSLSTTSCGAAL